MASRMEALFWQPSVPGPPAMAATPTDAGVAMVNPAGTDGRFVLHHVPDRGRAVRGAVVHVHAWAEEMNKSRTMAAAASRAMADAGWAVFQFDLMGCGDSTGRFVDARWDVWRDEVRAALAWVARRHPGAELWLWGQRLGALLAAEAACGGPYLPNLLFWQPPVQGKTAMQQFLRLKAAAQLADGGGKAVLESARADLAAGRPVEVGGYLLHPALHDAIQAARLTAPPLVPAPAAGVQQPRRRLVWLEVTAASEPSLAPASQQAVAAWQAAGWHADAEAVAGPPFWQTVEIERAPALVEATLAHLGASATPPPSEPLAVQVR